MWARVKRIVAVFFICLGLPACALSVDRIEVPYQSPTAWAFVKGADKVKFTVESSDGRTINRDRVGVKKNGYGMEMASIEAINDIPSTVGKAIEQELASRGFVIGAGGSRVEVQITRFYNDFKIGFFAGDAVAEVNLNVRVYGSDGRLKYVRLYEARGVEPNIQLASGDNARAALIQAFRNAVTAVVNDTRLQDVLLLKLNEPAKSFPRS